jgi:hypothetical protein
LLYNMQCVYSCPSYPIMYYANLLSATCVINCPAPYFSFAPTGQCQLSCPEGYYTYLGNNSCTACPNGCRTCNSSTECQSCSTGYLFVNIYNNCSQICNSTAIYYFNGQCLTNCIAGTYLLPDMVTCQTCSAECATCSGTGTNCTKCSTKFLYNSRCVDACPTDFYVDINQSCQACSTRPSACILPPLTYTISTFMLNYQLNAYVIFNRPVMMTISQFKQYVQIKRNGQPVKSSDFKASKFNSTAYLITFITDSVNEEVLVAEAKTIHQPQLISEVSGII